MTTRVDLPVAAGHSVDPGRWLGILDELMTRTGSRFRRVESRRRVRAFVLGLPAELPRVSCRTLAEYAGDSSPDGMQHLLLRSADVSLAWCPDLGSDLRGRMPGW